MSSKRKKEYEKEITILGIPGSPGIVTGKLFLVHRDKISTAKEIIPESEIEYEIARFREAVSEAANDIIKIKRNISEKLEGEAAGILDAQIMFINDPELNKQVVSIIREQSINAEHVYNDLISKVIKSLQKSNSEYLKQRVYDIKGIRARVLSRLRGIKQRHLVEMNEPYIIAARSLGAGEFAQMSGSDVIGLVTAIGGATSHTALLAKSLNIPSVLGIEDKFNLLQNGARIILDGNQGKIIVNPTSSSRELYKDREVKFVREREQLLVTKDEPAVTTDGRKVGLLANIELLSEVDKAINAGADGIGLYRSEFLYFTHGGLPSEEQQFRAYSRIVRKMHPKPVTIRTFDLGGDKFIDETHRPYERNPFLGWRAIRISLSLPEYFRCQLRAILRASAFGNVSMMLPMVSDISEIKKSKTMFTEVKEELRAKGIEFDENLKFGIMVEVPSAALNADSLAQHVDFFSIGTNDLTQYTLAVDRSNEALSELFQSFHPSVLKLTAMAIKEAKGAGIPVSICGELAGDPLAAALLVGLGADSLSAPYTMLPLIKEIIRKISSQEAGKLAQRALKLENTAEIRNSLANYLTDIFEGLSSPIHK
ncbi:MAG: phosphoenolpyruvate--protein phosphotransferase [candidate division Zixibacteria bacterium]|nr:phosphoenolpyruvate--protein phosphotransferase [candidate division Zixibacteria bacterium]